eukprot:TRINITY_DN16371_c0_g1_i3.p1 TRINITY_DN16371_c0_g1~~TRINITY_DN16371_c0_g1_i3.p1  ORF type:complete len:110 (-),score=25.15 TRINITY_DN16371_c0_g1_i3:17-346(-)
MCIRDRCYQHRLTQLATQLGRSITDSEKYYMDERIWRQHAYPEGRKPGDRRTRPTRDTLLNNVLSCLLYTSDAADEEDSVDLGGRRVFKKKKKMKARDVWWYVTGYIVS